MEVICVDGSFPADYLEFYKEHGIITPKEGSLYGIREVVKNMGKMDSTANVGFLLEELVNPKIPQMHSVLGVGGVTIEPNWAVRRFRNLDMSEISMEQVREQSGYIEANKILNTKLEYNDSKRQGRSR